MTPEIEQQMIDYLVKQKMPKSTTDYIIKKIQEGNVFSATLSATRTSLEGHIKQEAEKEYNPSSLEKLAGEVSAFVSNAVVTMGQGTIASFIGQTLLSTTANSMDHSQAQQEQYLEEKKKQANKEIAAANKKEVSIPSWMMKQMGISNISEASNEELMKAHEWAYQNALSYRNKIHATVSEGKRAVKASGKSNYISLTEATLQAKRYESFQRLLEDEITNRMNHPQWMMEKQQKSNFTWLHNGPVVMPRCIVTKSRKLLSMASLRLRHQAKIHKCRLMKQLQELCNMKHLPKQLKLKPIIEKSFHR